jgi:hypothetical protein
MKTFPGSAVLAVVSLGFGQLSLIGPVAAGIPAGAVEFATGGFSVGERTGTAVITVRRIQLDGDAFTVRYAAAEGDARAGALRRIRPTRRLPLPSWMMNVSRAWKRSG